MPSLSLRQWVVIAAILVVMLLLFRGCGDDDDIETAGTDAGVILPTEPPVFVEVVYEIAASPFEDDEIGFAPDTAGDGYVLDTLTENTPRLYPAIGKPVADIQQAPLWIGVSWINHDAPHGRVFQTLITADELEWSGVPTQDVLREFHGGHGSDAVLFPVDKLKLEVEDDGRLWVKALGESATLAGGERILLESDDEKWSATEYVQERDALLEKLDIDKEAYAPSLPAVEDLQPRFEDGRIHTRVSVRYYGTVSISSFDVQQQRQKYRDLIVSGPYDEARVATENVLLALPGDAAALRDWSYVDGLIEQGRAASRIDGIVVTANGDLFTGLLHVGLAEPDMPDGVTILNTRTEDGKFEFFLPSGEYELRVWSEPVNELQARVPVRLRGEENVQIRLD